MTDPTPIDMSKMSEGKRKALLLAESSRDPYRGRESFVANLFMGRFQWDQIHPFPSQPDDDKDAGEPFLKELERFLREDLDADRIDREGEIPEESITSLADMGALGIKIPKEYGGLGLSQTNYARAAELLGSVCGNTTALLSAHQSIGIPQPLLLFGTEAQKKKYLPRCARGELSAFALTETGVGSDPARMQTTATPTEDGSSYVLNGEKLWCTNGTRAGLFVVMARMATDKEHAHPKISAFIVERDQEGVHIEQRCHFMGLKALYNAVLRFDDVLVPKENVILGEGKGLKVALSTLNTGRLTLPAACAGLSKRCLSIMTTWGNEREQWGMPIGKHAAVADKIAQTACNLLATEAMTFYTCSLVDRKVSDIRLEAAMAKLWGTERGWEDIDACMQVRGGRGYETADSQIARGEPGEAVERLFRDARINTIFEGSSEIMRLFIAREALDSHLKALGPVMAPGLRPAERMNAGLHAAGYLLRWWPRLWIPCSIKTTQLPIQFRRHIHWSERRCRKLARHLFSSMLRYGPKLEREQILLGHFVDIGAELFAISLCCSQAESLVTADDADDLLALTHTFCLQARERIEEHERTLRRKTYRSAYRSAQTVLAAGESGTLLQGIVRR